MLEAPLEYITGSLPLDLFKSIYHPIATPPGANTPIQETDSATLTPVQVEGPLTPF